METGQNCRASESKLKLGILRIKNPVNFYMERI